jgi:hypothetical protein
MSKGLRNFSFGIWIYEEVSDGRQILFEEIRYPAGKYH